MSTPSYQQSDEDLQYLADLNNDYPGIPNLPESDTTAPKVNDVLGLPPPEGLQDPYAHTAAPEQDIPIVPPAAPVEPVAPAPAEPATVAPQSESAPAPVEPAAAPVAAEPPKQDWYSPLVSHELASADNGQSKLVSKAPNWYDFKAPPEITGNEAAIMSLAAGLIQAGLAHNTKTAIAMALGGVADAVNAKFAAPQQNYQNRLKAAEGQAQMAATLGAGRGSALGALNLDLAERKFKWMQDKYTDKAELERKLHDINSPESKEIRDALVTGGAFTPEAAAKLNGAQLNEARVAAQQQAGAARNQGNWVGRYNIGQGGKVEGEGRANTEWDRRQQIEEGQQIGKEGREQVKLDEQAEIPGFHYVGKRAPNIASVEKARVLGDALATAQTAAQHLSDIWGQMGPAAKAAPKWAEGFLSDEQKDLINEARIWGNTLDTAQRNMANMGVPQQFEMEIIKGINPDPSGFRALMNDGAAWRAQKRVMEKLGGARMQAYGYASDASEEIPTKHVSKPVQQRLKEAGQATKDLAGQVIGAGEQALSGAVGTAKDVVAPAVQKVLVRVHGGRWMPAPSDALDALKKKWGNALEVQTQGQTNAR